MMLKNDKKEAENVSRKFTNWLDDTLENVDITEAERMAKLNAWADAPSGKLSHPREEHLLPLHVCYGAAKTPVNQTLKFSIGTIPTRCYWWK